MMQAVPLAHEAGGVVICTARAVHAARLRTLGADIVIDYPSADFARQVKDVDLVLDLVGPAMLDRSWEVLSARGRLLSTVAPDVARRAPAGKRGQWFQVHPDVKRLAELAGRVASGSRCFPRPTVVDIADGPAALEQCKLGHAPTKSVFAFAAD